MNRFNIKEEAFRCLLCQDAPCSAACANGDPARAIRAVRFGNESVAARWVRDCSEEDIAAAERACIHKDMPIRIREIISSLPEPPAADRDLPSLDITFCGIPCENPFFLASSAVCTNYEMVAAAFEAGWAGVYYKTICLQDINEVSPRFDAVKRPDGTFAGFRNMEQLSENPAEVDFEILRRLKENYPSKVVIASIMGNSDNEWIQLAHMAENAGVDAIELNFSCPQMRLVGMGSDVGQNPELVAYYTIFVKRAVHIPVIAKMTPNVASMNLVATSAYLGGADGISAINTIKSVTMGGVVSGKKAISGYSGAAVKPIALRFILEMAMNPVLKGVQLSGIGGIYTWRDAVEFLSLGCRNVQVCTAIMECGQRIIEDLIEGLRNYLADQGLAHLEDLVGRGVGDFVTPAGLDRSTKVFPRVDRALCIGCGRCYISCRDGGHQAISFGEDRIPRIIGAKCVGCHLCRLICPVGAIGSAQRIHR